MPKFFKLVVFVPLSHLEKVRSAICAAGGGKIGNKYDSCAFYTEGTGTFRPLAGANPFVGKVGKVKKVREARLETIISSKAVNAAVAALLKAHPYEEPAFDLYPLIYRTSWRGRH